MEEERWAGKVRMISCGVAISIAGGVVSIVRSLSLCPFFHFFFIFFHFFFHYGLFVSRYKKPYAA